MKLCRFELSGEPGQIRSGIFHEHRIYETDGEQAIGVHDLTKIQLLAPLRLPPSVRVFEAPDSAPFTFQYQNPTLLRGPGAEFELPGLATEVGLEVRLAAIVGAPGDRIDAEEAPEYLLGISPMLTFVDHAMLRSERAVGNPPCHSRDIPSAVGPFLTTVDEMVGDAPGSALRQSYAVLVEVDEEPILQTEVLLDVPIEEWVVEATRSNAVVPGDLLAGPSFRLTPLPQTRLGRWLRPQDRLSVTLHEMGTLEVKLT